MPGNAFKFIKRSDRQGQISSVKEVFLDIYGKLFSGGLEVHLQILLLVIMKVSAIELINSKHICK